MGGTRNYMITETLGPLLLSMKIMGLYHEVSVNTNCVNPSPVLNVKKSQLWTKVFNCGTYCLAVVILLWFNFIRFCFGLYPRDEGFTTRIINLAWFAQCATTATVMYFACQRRTNMPTFVTYWKSLFDDMLATKVSCKAQLSRNHVVVVTVIAWGFFLLNTAGVSFLIYGSLNETFAFRYAIIAPFPDSTASVTIFFILHLLDTGAWILPVVFVVTLAYTIKLNFDNFSNTLEKHINQSDNRIPEYLRYFRCRHLNLCKAVAHLDRVFMYLMSVCFGSNIVLCCFILYEIVNSVLDPIPLAMHIFWLCVNTSILLATAISSSQVNDAAHSPLEHIYRIETRGATPEDIGQVNLFLSKLTGTSVGFTVLNMIVVNKEVILTIGGAFVTYFFLLLQFKIN